MKQPETRRPTLTFTPGTIEVRREERLKTMGAIGRRNVILVACVSVGSLQQCAAFVHPTTLRNRPRSTIHYLAGSTPAASPISRLSCLQMAKKGGGSGAKRKKKKAAEGSSSTGTSVADSKSSNVFTDSMIDELQDAGGAMLGGSSGGGFGEGQTVSGGLLEEGEVGSDAAREAKIQETLRKMGVKGVTEMKAKADAESGKGPGQQITSIFDLVPPETQLLMERVFIAGFALCLLFLVACGCAIGTEAYFLSTTGKLPPDLDNFIVQTLEPLFTPSLGATFAFSSALGVLKLGQMGQESVVYKEDD